MRNDFMRGIYGIVAACLLVTSVFYLNESIGLSIGFFVASLVVAALGLELS